MDPVDRRSAAIVLSAILVTFAGGTAGFMSILGESWHAALYRTIVSASLTGLDTTPRGPGAQALTVVLVLCGVAIFGYLAAQVVDAIARGILGGAWKEKRRLNMIDELRDHIIVCGYGRVGRKAAEEFRLARLPYVVLDYGAEAIAYARENDDLYIEGNGVDDDQLVRAGLNRARGLVVAADSDVDNLYVTLSAKAARPDLIVIARASGADAERKLRLAGADRVVTPYTSAGRMMAHLMIKPQVTTFVNVLTSARSPEFSIDEIEVSPDCDVAGQTIGDVDALETGAHIIALRRETEDSFTTRPPRGTVLTAGDVVVAVGAAQEIRALEEVFSRRQAVVR